MKGVASGDAPLLDEGREVVMSTKTRSWFTKLLLTKRDLKGALDVKREKQTKPGVWERDDTYSNVIIDQQAPFPAVFVSNNNDSHFPSQSMTDAKRLSLFIT